LLIILRYLDIQVDLWDFNQLACILRVFRQAPRSFLNASASKPAKSGCWVQENAKKAKQKMSKSFFIR